MGHIIFSESFNTIGSFKYREWVNAMFAMVKLVAFRRGADPIPILGRFAEYLVPKSMVEQSNLHMSLTRKTIESRQSRHTTQSGSDMMKSLIDAQGRKELEEQDIILNGEMFVIAAGEAAGSALAGATYYLLENRHAMDKLCQEIRTTFSSSDEITLASVAKLDYLLAVLNETMRLYPPAATSDPRTTPLEGLKVGEDLVPKQVR
jgi:cytochrome P450